MNNNKKEHGNQIIKIRGERTKTRLKTFKSKNKIKIYLKNSKDLNNEVTLNNEVALNLNNEMTLNNEVALNLNNNGNSYSICEPSGNESKNIKINQISDNKECKIEINPPSPFKNTTDLSSPSKNVKITIKKESHPINLIKNEKSFKIQIFSLEPIENFEIFLKSHKIEYLKGFTSNPPSKKSKIHLLLKDSENINSKSKRILLYNNKRNEEFIPYKFKTQSSPSFSKNDFIPDYISNSLNYIQSVILMAIMKGGDFKKILKEVKEIDPELDNSFLIKCELNWLFRNKYCLKSGNFYKLGISKESILKVYEKLGFPNCI